MKGPGQTKELDITVSSEYGDDIVWINIDDDADNKTTWFKIPDTPNPIQNGVKWKIIDYVKYANEGQDFYLEVHSALNASNIYFKLDSESFIFGPAYLEMSVKINNNKYIYGIGERVSPNLFL